MVVAAIALRVIAKQLEVLLVRTSSGDRWIFPKGSAQLQEHPASAAVRELAEESGWKAMSFETQPFCYLEKSPVDPPISCYLVTAARRVHEGERGRSPKWFGYEAGKTALSINRPGPEAEPYVKVLELAREQLIQEL